MRALAPAILLLLAACAPAQTEYSLGRGTLSYDELRRATDDCKARGGRIEPAGEGGDPTQLSNYVCVIPKDKNAQ